VGLSARTHKRGALLERWRAQCNYCFTDYTVVTEFTHARRVGVDAAYTRMLTVAFLSLRHLGLQPSPKQGRLWRPDGRCRPFILRLEQTRIVPYVQFVIDCDDGKAAGRGQLLAMRGLWRRMERSKGGAPLACRQAMEVMRPMQATFKRIPAARPSKTPAGIPINGRVARLRFGRGDGFIRLWNARDIYFHRADLHDNTTFNALRIGDLVAFELIEDAVSGARGVRVSRRTGP